MCGICGFTGASTDNAEDLSHLKAMCDIMAHRGPDGEGQYIDDGVALGHRRLSLIDLEGGNQPMVRSNSEKAALISSPALGPNSEACEGSEKAALKGDWAIVFNGEIYNYRDLRQELENDGYTFETNSDTEVLLVSYLAWGESMLLRLRGMFAFAIWNKQSSELFCARDFFGIKPFYYACETNEAGKPLFIFASEIKCILEHPAYERKLNEAALASYLCYQFSTLQESFFKGIFKLPQGHSLRVFADGSLKIKRYWQPSYELNEERTLDENVEEIDRIMHESVRYHNVADVEVGSFLSSGIDSSYMAACLSEENPDIKTFTVGFSEYAGEKDEISWAEELAETLKIQNTSKHINEAEYWESLPLVQWHMDEPSADPSAVALYFVDQLAATQVKAVLSGEGADEFFGGYRIYQAPLSSKKLKWLPKSLLKAASHAFRKLGLRGANYLERASENAEDWYYTNANGVAFSPEERKRVLNESLYQKLSQDTFEGGALEAIGLQKQNFKKLERSIQAQSKACAIPRTQAKTQAGSVQTRIATNDMQKTRMFTRAISHIPKPQELTAPLYAEVECFDESTRMQYVDLWFWLVGDILLKTDKMSMAHSLESRVPFLDREVFGISASLPKKQKISDKQTKIALRLAAEKTIPRDWAQKEKLGFPVPIAAWLREDRYYNQVKEAFTSEMACKFFNKEELLKLLDEHKEEKRDNTRRIWIIYMFLMWYKIYFIDQEKPTTRRA